MYGQTMELSFCSWTPEGSENTICPNTRLSRNTAPWRNVRHEIKIVTLQQSQWNGRPVNIVFRIGDVVPDGGCSIFEGSDNLTTYILG